MNNADQAVAKCYGVRRRGRVSAKGVELDFLPVVRSDVFPFFEMHNKKNHVVRGKKPSMVKRTRSLDSIVVLRVFLLYFAPVPGQSGHVDL